jgi:ribosome biogenesis protein SSF1/2
VAGPLGVTHLIMLSQTEKGPILRVARLPRGPTLTFRVSAYSLASAVRASQRRPVDIASAFEHPPLVVLHNFAAAAAAAPQSATAAGVSLPDALKMCMITFQNMFPAINPATVKLVSCRRVVLFHYHKGTGEIEVRHYIIRAMPVGITRAIKKMAQSRLPDLGRLEDVSEFVLSGGRGAAGGVASDSEFEDDVGHVTLPQVQL